MSARKTVRRSTYPTVELQPHLNSIFSTQRPHVCRQNIWGNFQAEGGEHLICCGIAYDSLISLVQVGKGRPLYLDVPEESDHTLCWS